MNTNTETGNTISSIVDPKEGQENDFKAHGVTPTGVTVTGFPVKLKNDWYILKPDPVCGIMLYYVVGTPVAN